MRNEALLPISKEHQYCMILCTKIAIGIQEGADLGRLKEHADWFFQKVP